MSALGPDSGLSEAATPPGPDDETVVTAPGTATSETATRHPAATARRRGRVLWSTVAAVLVLVLVAGGLVVGLRPKHDAPRHPAALPPRPSAATLPSPAQPGTNPDGTHYGPLTGFLLPIPHGYELGPDDGYAGDDGTVTAQQLAAANNDAVRELGTDLGLPQSDIDRGLTSPSQVSKTLRGAVISYAAANDDLDVTIELRQYAHPAYADDAAHDQRQLDDDMADLDGRPTFAVPGYPHAGCVYPMPTSHKLDEIDCYGESGDVLTYLTAMGVAPLSRHTVTALMADQLKLLQSEGASA